MGVGQLGLRLCLDGRIDGEGDVVGLIDGRGLGAALGESIAGLQRLQLQLVSRLDDPVELALQPLIALDTDRSTQQEVEGGVEVVLGRLHVSGRVVGLTPGVFSFGAGDQLFHGVDRGRRWGRLRRYGLDDGRRWRKSWCDGLGRGQRGIRIFCRLAGGE